MRAEVVHEYGGPDVLQLEEVDPPSPGEGEVLVRLRAASVNPVDWKNRTGYREQPLPLILGKDGAGIVEESNADGLAEGDAVFGSLTSGAYAELALASAEGIAKKPERLGFEQAAALPVAGLTAWQALFDKGNLQSGQTVLITGGSGGVGHLAVQFAKRAGAHVIATASSRNREFVLGLGADQFVDYTQEDVAQAAGEVDVVFDTVGGDVTTSLIPTLREGTVMVTIASAPPEQEAAERGARAELLVSYNQPEQLKQIGDLVASGEVRVEISETLPLEEIRRAHELSESGHARGKIVLTI
jgi:NADPH:quinone reductase-like Zn-dependent oxidoreductase